jgi:hypothetical protein
MLIPVPRTVRILPEKMSNWIVSHDYFRFLIKKTTPKTSRNAPKAESAVAKSAVAPS